MTLMQETPGAPFVIQSCFYLQYAGVHCRNIQSLMLRCVGASETTGGTGLTKCNKQCSAFFTHQLVDSLVHSCPQGLSSALRAQQHCKSCRGWHIPQQMQCIRCRHRPGRQHAGRKQAAQCDSVLQLSIEALCPVRGLRSAFLLFVPARLLLRAWTMGPHSPGCVPRNTILHKASVMPASKCSA